MLCATRDQALAVPRGDLRLTLDDASGLIRNIAFDPRLMAYGGSYENSLHFSPRFQAYADGLVRRLIERYDLRGKDVLEIACGQGDFLAALCAAGGNRGVGFDPAYIGSGSTQHANVRIEKDYYSDSHADVPADLICCRHALEHIADPLAFLRRLRRTIGDRPDTIVFFEVPNGLYTIRELGIWDLIYEHCTYFVPDSLRWCFAAAGFDVLDVRAVYDGQFITLEARPATQPAAAPHLSEPVRRQLQEYVAKFSAAYRAKVDFWRGQIADWRACGRRAVVWGSGSKGVTFLNIIQPIGVVDRVVDINPRKQGCFVAGTGQVIVPPQDLTTNPPDAVIVMNAIYLDEIQATLDALAVRAEVVTA